MANNPIFDCWPIEWWIITHTIKYVFSSDYDNLTPLVTLCVTNQKNWSYINIVGQSTINLNQENL